MRFFVLSDIHSNIEALQACIARAKLAGYDAVYCCGDIVGYGPNPAEAIEAVRGLNPVTIRGNHDRVAADDSDASEFNPHARRAIQWTRSVLPDSYRNYLASLPVGPVTVSDDAQLVHGALTHEDDYIFTSSDVAHNLRMAAKRMTFFGHSHFPAVYANDVKGNPVNPPTYEFDEFTAVRCDGNQRFLINPGSVGQPRDGDARASFLIWDQERERLEFYRVEYPIEVTQAKMAEAHLPAYLIDRLAVGR
jgi:predicted phosphodiesterase